VYNYCGSQKKGTEGNKIADQLLKRGSLHPFIGPEPASGISDRIAGQVIMDWVYREKDYWQSILG
jgi:hypothetical protein